MSRLKERVDRFFGVSAKGSSVSTEIQAGIITFLAMSYILIVNPNIMSDAGMDWSSAFTATAISAAVGTAVMALYAKFPVALAPGMGINAFFSYTVVISMGYTWEQALGAVFLSGILFVLISVTGLRIRILDSIPINLRYAIITGIGLFIAFVGLNNSGIIVSDPSTLVTLGDLTSPLSMLAMICIASTLILHFLKVRGSILIGILITVAIGILTGVLGVPSGIASVPVMPDAGAFLTGLATVEWSIPFITVIFSFLMVDFFDTAGTLFAVGRQANIIGDDGKLQNVSRALTADAGATMISAVVGSTPVTSYVESTAGIDSGGRTGLMTLVVAIMFVVALFLAPLFSVVTAQCTVAALLLVGAAMMINISKIDWKDGVVAVSSFLTIIMMVLTYSITNGIAIGFIVYCLGMAVTGRIRETGLMVPVMALMFVLYFVIMAVTF